MRLAYTAAMVGVAFLGQVATLAAQTYTWDSPSNGGNDARWTTATNWDLDSGYPDGSDDAAVFGSPSATRTIEVDGNITLGALSFESDANFTQSLRNYDFGNSLIFDGPGDTVTITVGGTGTSNNRMMVDMVLQDNVIADVQNTGNAGAAGTLAFTGNATGPGSFTKAGDGTITVAANAGSSNQDHAWEGPTFVLGGRWRTSEQGTHGMLTESFTVDGGQITMITNGGVYTFGPGPLKLNGFGPTSGPNATNKGAIRPNTNLVGTITNDVVIETDASIGLFGASTEITLSGSVSGAGKFYLDAVSGEPHNHGTLVVTQPSTHDGGLYVIQGIYQLSGESATAGLGDIFVDGVSDRGVGIFGSGRLDIQAGVANAIADDATVTLTGGTFGGWAILGDGVDDLVGSLVLGGTTHTAAGTYGSSSSGADFQFDAYFSGGGVLRLAGAPGLDGDYNEDGVVNAADYVLWRKSPDDFGGDPTGYNTWKQHFGMSNEVAGNGGAVPEPAAFVLVGLIVPLALVGRRRAWAGGRGV